jgi:hypothetical protein
MNTSVRTRGSVSRGPLATCSGSSLYVPHEAQYTLALVQLGTNTQRRNARRYADIVDPTRDLWIFVAESFLGFSRASRFLFFFFAASVHRMDTLSLKPDCVQDKVR